MKISSSYVDIPVHNWEGGGNWARDRFESSWHIGVVIYSTDCFRHCYRQRRKIREMTFGLARWRSLVILAEAVLEESSLEGRR